MQSDNRNATLQGEADLGERTVVAVNSDYGMGGFNHGYISGVAHTGGGGNLNIRVTISRVIAGQDAYGQPRFDGGSSAGCLHNAGQAAADQNSPPLSQLSAHSLG